MIRPYQPADREAVLALSLRAWEPVFAGMRSVLPPALASVVWPDWESEQRDAVLAELDEHADDTLVVTLGDDGTDVIAGFASVLVNGDRGAVHMIAVDPAQQRRGLARSLLDAAADRMRERGVRLAYIGTGGDPGHAPARALYEAEGYRAVPGMHYFKAL